MPTNLMTLPGLGPYGKSLLLQNGDISFQFNADGLQELQMVGGIENLAQGHRAEGNVCHLGPPECVAGNSADININSMPTQVEFPGFCWLALDFYGCG